MEWISHVFFGPQRMRSGWRILLFSLANPNLDIWLLGGLLLGFRLTAARIPHIQSLFIPLSMIILLIITLVVAWLMTRYVDRRPFASLGLNFHPHWWQALAWGILLGVLFQTLMPALIFTWETGHPFWTFNPLRMPHEWLLIVLALPYFLSIAIMEELSFRGYLLQSTMEGIGTIPAILFTSGLFGIAHWGEGGLDPVLSNALWGIVWSFTVIRTRALWWAIGFHFSRDFTIAILQYPTSGPYLGDLVFILSVGLLILGALTLTPTPQAKTLWDRYIHPAPWPPWRRRAQSETESLPDEQSLEDAKWTGEK